MSYQARRPFQIKSVLGNNSYEVKLYNKLKSSTRKYKGTDPYLLLPSIFPHGPLYTMDIRFLNYSQASIVSLLHKPLIIDMYNNQYFKPNHIKQKVEQPIK